MRTMLLVLAILFAIVYAIEKLPAAIVTGNVASTAIDIIINVGVVFAAAMLARRMLANVNKDKKKK